MASMPIPVCRSASKAHGDPGTDIEFSGKEWLRVFRGYVGDLAEAVRREAAAGETLDGVKRRVAYLTDHGYRILPVNPTIAGQRVFGVPAVARLADLAEPADMVEVFRRPQYLPGHAEEILAMPQRPAAVWFQLGIRHDATPSGWPLQASASCRTAA